MMEELKIGRAVQANPYVIQMDRFVQSLEKLTKVFLQLERKHDLFTKAEMEEMYMRKCAASVRIKKCVLDKRRF